MKKFIFIVPVNRWSLVVPATPTNVLQIVTYLRSRLTVEVEVIDMQMEYGVPLNQEGEEKIYHLAVADLENRINENSILGISATSSNCLVASLPLVAQIKKKFSCPIVIGGYAATSAGQLILEDYPRYFDAVVLGAGEIPCEKIVQELDGNIIHWENIPGVAYVKDGRIIRNEAPDMLSFNDLPVLDFSILRYAHLYDRLVYNSSQGCVFNCEYCFEKMVHPRFQYREPVKVMADIEAAGKFISPEAGIIFYDAIFGLHRPQVGELCRQLKTNRRQFFFETRGDVFPLDLYPVLEGNCKAIYFGLEAASPKTLERMKKTTNPQIYLNSIRKQIEACFNHRIVPMIGLMLNYPLKTEEELKEDLFFAQEMRQLYFLGNYNSGISFLPFLYEIHYNEPFYYRLSILEKEGLVARPFFPIQYHGIPVRKELQLSVVKPSLDVTEEQVFFYAQEILKQIVISSNTNQELRKVTIINLRPFYQGEMKEAQYFLEEGKIINLRKVMENIEIYSVKNPPVISVGKA